MGSEGKEGGRPSDEVYILVDGSNVAYGTGIHNSPKLERIISVLRELGRHPFRIITMVDAKLRHNIDDRDKLEDLLTEKVIFQVPARTQADDFLIQLAQRIQSRGKAAYILTNDLFPLRDPKGTVPRIAFMAIPIDGSEEWIFNPPLESLLVDHIETSMEVEREQMPIERELLETYLAFIGTHNPPLNEGDAIAFSQVAGYLHNQWDGNFCRRFGYEKPKEFAMALESNGYVKLRSDDKALYLVILRKTLEEAESFLEQPEPAPEVETSPEVPVYDEEEYLLTKVLYSLREEGHYPSEKRIMIKFSKMGIGEERSREILNRCVERGHVEKRVEPLGNDLVNMYWPVGERWDAVDPNDPQDRYTPEEWMAFRRAIQELPSNQRIAQTRYFLAKNLKKMNMPELVDLTQAEMEHMVQLAVNRGILRRVYTTVGSRISVPPEEI